MHKSAAVVIAFLRSLPPLAEVRDVRLREPPQGVSGPPESMDAKDVGFGKYRHPDPHLPQVIRLIEVIIQTFPNRNLMNWNGVR